MRVVGKVPDANIPNTWVRCMWGAIRARLSRVGPVTNISPSSTTTT